MAPDQTDRIFRVKLGDLEQGEVEILRLQGTEGISQLYCFDLEIVGESSSLEFDKVVAKPVAIEIAGNDGDRYVNGIAARFEQGAIGKHFTRYTVQVVPRFWTLVHRADCRIFQDKTTSEIIKEVFDAAGILSDTWKDETKAEYHKREFCVQYQESDWDFVSRLMEEEGIFYYFEHTREDHLLKLGDKSTLFGNIEGKSEVIFRDPAGMVPTEEYIAHFRYAQSIRVGATASRDYNFTKPSVSLSSRAQAESHSEYETFEYPGRYGAQGDGKRLNDVRLEEHQALRLVATGDSVCRRFTPGFKFEQAENPREDLNKAYLITDVEHDGYEPQVLREEMPANRTEGEYSNRFRCIPDGIEFRPPRVTPRPFVRGTQEAVVVGPDGEEIYTDEYGRVKCQFFWHRDGESNESSSVWMRVGMPTAGQGWGTFAIPRIGQEVLVSFMDGDPDCPCVVGSVHNANQMPPYALPDNKTISTRKSASSPGADGFNEVRFEDKKGEEHIFVHAEKDHHTRVKNDLHESVLANRHFTVGGNAYEKVSGDTHRIVEGDTLQKIEGASSETIVGDCTVKKEASDFLQIGADQQIDITGDYGHSVGGTVNRLVTGDIFEFSGGTHNLTAMNQVTDADMNMHLKGGMNVVIEAGMNLTLKVGGNFVVIDMMGVHINGTLININSGGSAGSGDGITLDGTVSVPTPDEPEEAAAALDDASGETPATEPNPEEVPEGEYSAQAIALREAADSGTPFCEQCEAARAEQQQSQSEVPGESLPGGGVHDPDLQQSLPAAGGGADASDPGAGQSLPGGGVHDPDAGESRPAGGSSSGGGGGGGGMDDEEEEVMM